MMRHVHALCLALVAAMTACASSTPQPSAEPVVAVPVDHRLDRVSIIGASASAGFLANVMTDRGPTRLTLAAVTEAMLMLPRHDAPRELGKTRLYSPAPDPEVLSLASEMFFLSPMQAADYQLQTATTNDPTCIIGIDFLFWFGYGNVTPDAGESETDARLRRLEDGLSRLNDVGTPIVLGDLPDMSGAIGTVLSPKQVPSPQAIEALNERIRAWAAERPDVLLLPFGEFVGRLKSDEPFELRGNRWTQEDAEGLLLGDRLHPSPEGLILLGIFLADGLITQGWADPERLTLDRDEIRRAIASDGRPE